MSTPDTTEQPRLTVGVALDVGRSRKGKPNQDSVGIYSDYCKDAARLEAKGLLFVVADGMGGAAGGKEASETAVETVTTTFYDDPEADIAASLERAIQAANTKIRQRGQEDPSLGGLGTTFVAALIHGDHMVVVNVGDSRAYLLREGSLSLLSLDHTVVQEQVRDGILTAEEAETHPRRHVLSRNLGSRSQARPDFMTMTLEAGDVILLCSDGLWGSVDEDEIAAILQQQRGNTAARTLIDLANEHGGPDNISAVVVHFEGYGDKGLGRRTKPLFAAATTALVPDEPPARAATTTFVPTDPQQATRTTTTPRPVKPRTETAAQRPKRRSPWLWPLAAGGASLLAILAVLVLGNTGLLGGRETAGSTVGTSVTVVSGDSTLLTDRTAEAATTLSAPPSPTIEATVAPTRAPTTAPATAPAEAATIAPPPESTSVITVRTEPLRTIEHEDSVRSVAFSADGRWLASGSSDGKVRLWNVDGADPAAGRPNEAVVAAFAQLGAATTSTPDDGGPADAPDPAATSSPLLDELATSTAEPGETDRPIRELPMGSSAVVSVAFDPTGKNLAAASDDGAVMVWLVSNGSPTPVTGPFGPVMNVAFTGDGQMLAVASKDGRLTLVRLSDQTVSRPSTDSSDPITTTTMAFSPNGQTLAGALRDGTIALWQVEDGKRLQPLEGNSKIVTSLAFTQDGKTLAAAAQNGTITLWQVSDGTPIGTIEGQTDQVASLAFSPDGQTLAAASGNGTISLWQVSDGTSLGILGEHGQVVESMAFSPRGKILASASTDKTVKLWSVERVTSEPDADNRGGAVQGSNEPAETVTSAPPPSPTPAESATSPAGSGVQGAPLPSLEGHTAPVLSVAFAAEGRTLASVSNDGAVVLWQTSDGTRQNTLAASGQVVTNVALAANGELLASAVEGGSLLLHRTSDGALLQVLQTSTAAVTSIAFAPDGATLASATKNEKLRLWRLSDGPPTAVPEQSTKEVTSLAFAAEGQMLAAASTDRTVRLWQVSEGRVGVVRTLAGPVGNVTSLALTRDGNTLATAGDDRIIRLWRVSNGSLLATLEGDPHTDRVTSLAFTQQGDLLASGSADDTVKLWRVGDGRLVETFRGHTDDVNSVAFAPDGQTLASGSSDRTVRVWPISIGAGVGSARGNNDQVANRRDE